MATRKLTSVAFIAAVSLTSCESIPPRISVTYLSEPPSASLTVGGQILGRAPAVLFYDYSAVVQSQGRLQGGTAQWVSGAKAEAPLITLPINGATSFTYTFVRPSEHPGLQTDIDYFEVLSRLNSDAERAAAEGVEAEAAACQAASSAAETSCSYDASRDPLGNQAYNCGQSRALMRLACY
jgi:hypothetical protein